MKYIRTEYGIEKIDNDWALFCEEHAINKQADTIEELCDEFVVFEESGNNGLPLTCPKEKFEEIKSYIILGMINNFNIWLKGAIWTSKGLIYVAKMNDKGVLELL